MAANPNDTQADLKQISDYIDNDKCILAMSLLYDRITKIYAGKAQLDLKLRTLGSTYKGESSTVLHYFGTSIQTVAADYLQNQYERLALKLGHHLMTATPPALLQALRAYQLIKFIGFYHPGLQEVFPVEARNYSSAQRNIVTICTNLLQSNSLSAEEQQKYKELLLRSTLNPYKDTTSDLKGTNLALTFFAAFKQYIGEDQAIAFPTSDELTKSNGEQIKLLTCKFYLNLAAAIRNYVNSEQTSKASYESITLTNVCLLFQTIFATKTKAESNEKRKLLLQLLAGEINAKTKEPNQNINKLFTNFNVETEMTSDFLYLELPLFLSNILRDLKLKKTATATASASNTSTAAASNPATTTAASTAAGTPIVQAYLSEMAAALNQSVVDQKSEAKKASPSIAN